MPAPATILHRAHANNTINNVSAFMTGVDSLVRRERLGHYPGGTSRSLDRRAVIGSSIIHWTKRTLKSGMYPDAIRFLVRGWSMVLAALARKFWVILRGRKPSEIIK